jgi:hypothetical protein
MRRLRAADDFAAIRARMEELRRESEEGMKPDKQEPQKSQVDAGHGFGTRLQMDLLRLRRRL